MIKSMIKANIAERCDSTPVTGYHCIKTDRIQSQSGPYFPAFGLNFRIQCECGKMQTRITPNTDTFHGVYDTNQIEILAKLKKGQW